MNMKNNAPSALDETELLAYVNGVFTAAISKALRDVHLHILAQRDASIANDFDEYKRLDVAEPERWLAMARTDFQTALMRLNRAIAQPTTF